MRDQGEHAIAELLDALPAPARRRRWPASRGLSWRRRRRAGAQRRAPRDAAASTPALLPYEKLGDPRKYLVKTFLGARTAVHQAALGCRFRCTFCGVAAMFRGATLLPPAARLERELRHLRDAFGADSLQFFDHNFFDREEDMVPLLEVLARLECPGGVMRAPTRW